MAGDLTSQIVMLTRIISVITDIILIPLGALLLMYLTKFFKLKDRSYKSAIKINVVIGIIFIILDFIGSYRIIPYRTLLEIVVLAIASFWFIIKIYKLNLNKTLILSLVWVVLFLILKFILLFILLAIGLLQVVPLN